MIHRGLLKIGATRFRCLWAHARRTNEGDRRLRHNRASIIEAQIAVRRDIDALDSASPTLSADEIARRRSAKQSILERGAAARAKIDAAIMRQRRHDERLGQKLMSDLRRELMTTDTEAAATAHCARQAHVCKSLAFYEAMIRQSTASFFRLMPVRSAPTQLRFLSSPTTRAMMKPDDQIFLFEPDRGQIWHELAHLAELAAPEVYRSCVAWRRARGLNSHGELKIRPLDEIQPAMGYQSDERAIEDDFCMPYVGACYDPETLRSTEVLSIGLQHFVSAAAMFRLFKCDPEHFALVVGAICHARL